MIDADAEISKAEKKRAFAQAAADKLKTGAAAPDYDTKKPEAARIKDAEKVRLRFSPALRVPQADSRLSSSTDARLGCRDHVPDD